MVTTELKTLRHSAAELLAIAVWSLFPKVQLVSGETTALGFHYDFFFPDPINEEQIPFIEERMRDFMRQNLPIKNMEMMRKNAIELFKHHRQDLKVALLKANVETLVHVCQIGQFYDLAYPPLVETTQQVGVIKILDITKLNVSLPQHPQISLTRIQGTAFLDHGSLKQFLKRAEAAKHRDHRLLGREMNLFVTFDEACPGCWFWYPKGTILREILINLWRQAYDQQHYQKVATPHLVKVDLLNDSQLSLSFEREGLPYTVCSSKAPLHALMFKSKLRSYRELPLRFWEFGEFYEPAKEGSLWGLLRSRTFTVEGAYLFGTPEQVLPEIISSLQFIDKTFKIFGFEIQWHLRAKSANNKKPLEQWKESQDILIKAIKQCGFNYALDEEREALYGPTLEGHFMDAIGREWKGPYIYIDLYHPKKFKLRYQGQDDRMHVPMMVGRSLFGSIERLVAILVEHYSGRLPFGLAPEQVRVIPVADKNGEYAKKIAQEIEKAGFRATVDHHRENLGVKIHAAESEKVSYMVICGDREEKNETVTLRTYQQEKGQEGIELENFLSLLKTL